MQLFILPSYYQELIKLPKPLLSNKTLYSWASIQNASAALGDDFQLKLSISPKLNPQSPKSRFCTNLEYKLVMIPVIKHRGDHAFPYHVAQKCNSCLVHRITPS